MIARTSCGAIVGSLLFFAATAGAIEPEDYAWERCNAYPDSCPGHDVDRGPGVPLRAHSGLQLGARLAYGAPAGRLAGPDVASAPSTSDVLGDWLGLGLEAGYRVTPVIYLGGVALWGPATGHAGTTHGASIAQLLFDVRFYLAPQRRSGAWLAFDTGWEIATLDAGGGHATYQGPVVADFQLGYDVRGGAVAIAPYVRFAIADFVTHSLDPAPAGFVAALDARASHEWLTVGVRGSFGPW